MHRLIAGSFILLFMLAGWGHLSWGSQDSAPRGEIRVVDSHRYNFISVVFNVFEHLMALGPDGQLVPRLAVRWQWFDDRTLEMVLRQGVAFHNGERFDAEILKLNWEENIRLQQPYLAGQFLNFGYPFSPGHFVSSITYHDDLTALPWKGSLVDLR
jgi:ABC-type transport system substrate-binding protein